jgi:gas vesicle protein
MTDSPDVLRAETERTRLELGRDVDALADKVTPSKIMDRQTTRIRHAFASMRDSVMGAAHDTEQSASAMASDVAEGARQTVRKAQGNPMAVGLIAFGAGLLAASLIPASEKEKELARSAKEQAQPLMDEVSNVAQDVASDLKEPAQDAMTAVKEEAADAVAHVKEEASDGAQEVKDRAQQAREGTAGR